MEDKNILQEIFDERYAGKYFRGIDGSDELKSELEKLTLSTEDPDFSKKAFEFAQKVFCVMRMRLVNNCVSSIPMNYAHTNPTNIVFKF